MKSRKVEPQIGDDQFSEEETARREDAALKRILSTPPKPHSAMKLGKRETASEKVAMKKLERLKDKPHGK
jgi:hypothetical protein